MKDIILTLHYNEYSFKFEFFWNIALNNREYKYFYVKDKYTIYFYNPSLHI